MIVFQLVDRPPRVEPSNKGKHIGQDDRCGRFARLIQADTCSCVSSDISNFAG